MATPHAQKSTNVRFDDAPDWVRTGFLTVGSLAPHLAAIAAERLFCTPPRPRPTERIRSALAKATPFEVRGPAGRLVAWSWGEGPAVLLVHGWGGLGGQLASFAAGFADAGFRAIAFDGPAHGISDGSRTDLVDFAGAILAMGDHLGPLAAVIAHSFGAASATIAMDRGLQTKRVVFVGPPFDAERAAMRFAERIALPDSARLAMQHRIERRVGVKMSGLYLPKLAAKREEPLRVYHDRSDDEVPWEAGAAIACAWPSAELVTTEGLGHYKILHDPRVIAGSVAFVRGGSPLAREIESRPALSIASSAPTTAPESPMALVGRAA